MRIAVLAAVVALAAGAGQAWAGSAPVVTVTSPQATRTVSVAEFHHWMRVVRAEGFRPKRREAEREVLELLITDLWIRGEAQERGIVVTDAEVRAAFRRQRRESFRSRAEFRRFLRRTKQTLADIRMHVRIDLLSDRIREQVITPAAAGVTDAQVDAALRAAGPQTIPERRDIRVVLTRSRAAARRARAALEAGASWAAVALRYSTDRATRRNGGLLRGVLRAQLERPLAGAVFRAPLRRLRGPVRTRFGYYVFEVVRVHPARVMPVSRQRALIRARLIADAQQAALDAFVPAFEARWRARTICAPAYTWVQDCGNAR